VIITNAVRSLPVMPEQQTSRRHLLRLAIPSRTSRSPSRSRRTASRKSGGIGMTARLLVVAAADHWHIRDRRLILHIFAVLRQFEVELLREQTRTALAASRARGSVGGCPPATATLASGTMTAAEVPPAGWMEPLDVVPARTGWTYRCCRERDISRSLFRLRISI
jgi:hypothetical protein